MDRAKPMVDEHSDSDDAVANSPLKEEARLAEARSAETHSEAPGQSPPGESTPRSDEPTALAPQPVARYFSFIFLLGVIGLVGMIFYWVMARFLIPLFLAALLVVIFRPLHRWMLEKTKGRQAIAAMLTTLSVLLAVLVPIGLLIVMAAAEGRDVLKQFNSAKILSDIQDARTKLQLDLPNAHQIRNIDARFLTLQTTAIADRSDLESQSSNLFEIVRASDKIAETQHYQEPEPADPTHEEAVLSKTVERKWQCFYANLIETKEIQKLLLSKTNIRDDTSAPPLRKDKNSEGVEGDQDTPSDPIEQYNSTFHDYQEMIHETARSFDAFKYDLLGGRTRAFAIEFLNPTDEKLQSYATIGGQFLKDQVVRFGGFAGSVLGSLFLGSAIMVISLYFFLLDGPAMLESFKGLSPLDDAHEVALVEEFANVSRAVVVATLLSALVQGILAGIGFYFASLDSIFLLTLLSAVLAMVPFVGAAAVWVPCSLYLYFFDNDLTAAIALAVYGVAVISMADNFIKPYVLHGTSNLHPLLALLSVIGGVTALGPIGILIGPMVVVFLQTLLKILQRELSIMDGEATALPIPSSSLRFENSIR